MSEKYKETPFGWWGVTKPLEELLVENDCEVGQMKEKFAELRCYFHMPDFDLTTYDKMRGAVELAEKLCSTMCQDCGQQGEVDYSTGWYIVLCDEHNKG